jgi:hypothetical protein
MLSNYDFDLGPLWNRVPKPSGFRLAIPDPEELFDWLRETSARHGDTSTRELIKLNYAALGKFQMNLSRRMFSGERVWIQPIDDELLSHAKTLMRATYSQTGGEWGDIVTYVSLSPVALMQGLQWTIPCKAEEIVRTMRDHDLDATLYVEDDGSQGLRIANPKGGGTIEVCLGYKTHEDALRAELEICGEPYEVTYRESIFAFNDSLAVQLPEYLEDLRHYQVTFSYLVDSLYQVLDRKPPDVIMELSVLTELA